MKLYQFHFDRNKYDRKLIADSSLENENDTVFK